MQWVSPLIAMILVLSLLYILGLFARSWVHRAIDWTLLHVPVVTTIYKAIRNVFQSLDNQLQGNSFKRVVLIPYPFEGSKVLGFVTKTLSDATTGQSIACVCVLTGVMPPAGITLFVPEENVVDVDWTVNQAIQAIVSGGITIPSVIHYTSGIDAPPTGPIVDRTGPPDPARPGGRCGHGREPGGARLIHRPADAGHLAGEGSGPDPLEPAPASDSSMRGGAIIVVIGTITSSFSRTGRLAGAAGIVVRAANEAEIERLEDGDVSDRRGDADDQAEVGPGAGPSSRDHHPDGCSQAGAPEQDDEGLHQEKDRERADPLDPVRWQAQQRVHLRDLVDQADAASS